MNVQYLTQGKKRGVFLSLPQWNALRKELDALQSKLNSIEKRRKEILASFKQAKKEKHVFTSDIQKLKSSLR